MGYSDSQLREYFATAASDGGCPRNVVLWLDSGIVDFTDSKKGVHEKLSVAKDQQIADQHDVEPVKSRSTKPHQQPKADPTPADKDPPSSHPEMEAFLKEHPYVGGFAPSSEDARLYS